MRRLHRLPEALDPVLLAAACVLVYLVSAGHPILGSSARYYEAAREMRQIGDWSIPHLHYTPYGEKPPLVYWLGALARSFGGGPRATSLPSLIATILTLWLTWALGRAVASRALGLGAAFLLLGTSFVQAMAGVLIPDTLLTATTAFAWWTFWQWERSGRSRSRWLIGLYASIGVGWMIKGPVALLLPAMGIALYTLLADGWTGPFRCLSRMRPVVGLLVIVALNLPWTVEWWRRYPRLLEFFYVRINIESFLYGDYNHPRVWWYYGPVVLGSLMPFTLVVVPVLIAEWWRGLRQVKWKHGGPAAGKKSDRSALYLTCCSLGPLLLLSTSSSKLGTYLMPLMPVVAILIALRVARWSRTPRWFTATSFVQAAAFFALLIFALRVFPASVRQNRVVLFGHEFIGPRDASSIDWSRAWIALVVLGAMFAGSVGLWIGALRKRPVAGLVALAVGFSIGTSVLLGTMDRLVPRWDSAALVRDLRARGGDDPALPPGQRDTVLVDRSAVQDYVIPFTLGRRVGIVDRAEESGLGLFIEAHPDPDVPMPGPGQPIKHPYQVSGENTEHERLWSYDRLGDAWNGSRRVWMITREGGIRNLTSRGLHVYRISHVRDVWLLCNRP